ncbi:MAG: organic hydroperoxide resistance protein [Steroidobacteraceae bacterium]
MTTLYNTKVTAKGGRDGSVASDDGLLRLALTPPQGLGGKGGATNPEQLFAAGYAACFASAAAHVARTRNIKLDDCAIEVTADVSLLSSTTGAFSLAVALDVKIAGVDQSTAEDITRTAHGVCPYSNATRGNIEVGLSANGVSLSKSD